MVNESQEEEDHLERSLSAQGYDILSADSYRIWCRFHKMLDFEIGHINELSGHSYLDFKSKVENCLIKKLVFTKEYE